MFDDTGSIVAAVFGKLPEPELQPECPECLNFQEKRGAAAGQGDESAVADARVLWRNHLAYVHGITYRGISYQ